MIFVMLLLPLTAGLASFMVYSDTVRRAMLLSCAMLVFGLVVACWVELPEPFENRGSVILGLDAPGLLVLTISSLLFLAASVYAVGYLSHEDKTLRQDFQRKLLFSNVPEAVFTACLLLFFAATILVALSQHLGLLWVGIEATTLASAPLIYFHRHRRSLEATWKYLIICSVGIALALLGNFFLDVAWQGSMGADAVMTMPTLLRNAAVVNEQWFKAAFIFMFIGYGTKVGLAPMHTWLPDAHSEAPSLVSCLLSGALLNCALLGIIRLCQLSKAAGFSAFSQELCVLFGLVSMGLAAMFIVGQGDFKRMLAYSSVEHMGVIVLGLGVGGIASLGSMLHMLCHSLSKAALFLLAGNILAAYHTQTIQDISGLTRVLKRTGPLWIAGFFAIVGSPPFGIFASEFTLLRGMFNQGLLLVPSLYLLFLGIIFAGMAKSCIQMSEGPAPKGIQPVPESWLTVAPSASLLSICLVLGVYQPEWLRQILRQAAQCVVGVLQ